MFDLLIENTSEVLRVETTDLEALARGVVGISGDRVVYLGSASGLPEGAIGPETRRIDAAGCFVGPGFVDPHTHLVFAGDRAAEFEQRCLGASYLELAAKGGGIMSTVRATRAASFEELCASALPRLHRLVQHGVTTVEVKSGYGLDLETELKMLQVARWLGTSGLADVVPTLLCAHAIPEEYRSNREGYLEVCLNEILPRVAAEKAAVFCDAFVEQSAFTADEARRLFEKASALGLRPRLHVDQITSGGGAELAAELGAATADHLEMISDAGIEALARANVSAVLVPVSTLYLRQRTWAPGRKLRDAGVNVALGSNVNPGSAMSENLGLTLSLACLENGLSAAEAYYGLTRGAALALGLSDRGVLAEGGRADMVVFNTGSYRHLPYHLGVNHARTVIRGGKVVWDGAPAPLCM